MKNKIAKRISITLLGMAFCVVPTLAQEQALSHRDFFYAGEGKIHHMYIVRDGKIAWHYHNPQSRGEISDASLLENGNVLFAHQFGVTEITADKEVVWSIDAPKGTEIHTVQPIGKDHIVYVQNGDTAKLVVMNIRLKKIIRAFPLETQQPPKVHGQFRNARLTDKGTLLVAHMDFGKVREYNSKGDILLDIAIPGPWSVAPLKNGNIMITSNKGFVREINRRGETVWEILLRNNPDHDYKVTSPQVSYRLPNGNTIINNWFNQWGKKPLDPDNPPLQAIEVSPDKKVVWELCAWKDPVNLGPSTIIQPLDEPLIRENMFFGDIN